MAWDDTKSSSTAASTLPASEWNDMVTDQKARAATSSLGTAAYAASTAFAAALGADDNYVTDAEKVVIGNTSGTNSGNVTLAGTPDYITISGQQITRGLVDLTSDVTGYLPVANIVTSTDASSTTYLRGDGAWATPAGGSSSSLMSYVTVGSTGSGADYECDGTNDNVQIQAAINASSTGGIVHILPGTYNTSVSLSMRDNVVLRGSGWTTELIMTAATSTAMVLCDGISNFGIEDIKINHYNTNKTGGSNIWAGSDCADYYFHRVYALNGYSNNIIAGGNNISIKDCRVDNTVTADGLLIHTGSNATINGCIVSGCQGSTANGVAVYASTSTAHDVTISNCVSYNNGSYGFQVERAWGVVVSNCVSYDNGGGFGCNGTSTYAPYDVSYSNCFSRNNSGGGVVLNAGSKIVVDNCIIRDEGAEGVKIGGSYPVEDVTISNCSIYDTTGAGIRCYNTSSSTTGYVFTGNNIVGTGSYGISSGVAPESIITNNTIHSTSNGILSSGQKSIISNNYVYTGGGQYVTGITIEASTGVESIISNNYIEHSGSHGILIKANKCNVTGNVVKNSGIYSASSGIYIDSGINHTIVANNTLFDDQGTPTQNYGINIASGCDYIFVSNNDIFDNSTGVINGSVGSNGSSTIGDVVSDTTPQLGGNMDWNSNGMIIAGQTVGGSDGNLVYLSSANTWSQADADTSSTCSGALGIRVSSTVVLTHGIYTTSGLTAGATYYASTTAGGITSTAPSGSGDIVRIVGYGLSTTELLFDPDKTYIEVA